MNQTSEDLEGLAQGEVPPPAEVEELTPDQVMTALVQENEALRLRLAVLHGKHVALVGKLTPKGVNVTSKEWHERRRRNKVARAARKRNR